MSLFKDWEDLAQKERNQEEYDAFWEEYLTKEQKIYQNILGNMTTVITGKVSELAEKFGMDAVTFAGFLYGINTSLVTPLELDALTEDTEVDLEIDFEKLYFNMHEAKAEWLYDLKEWEGILSLEKRKEIKKQYNISKMVVNENKVGRNDPCPCGSGKKYKKCCGK